MTPTLPDAAASSPGLTRMAVVATAHCLTGCALGEVLGMVIGTALGMSDLATVALAVTLAFAFGYAFTLRGLFKAGLALSAALRAALGADTLSITVMEIVDNAIMLSVPGAMDAGVTSSLFWGALAVALAVAFVVTVPVNRWLIARGRGHAVVHAVHAGTSRHDGHDGHGPSPAGTASPSHSAGRSAPTEELR